MKSIIFWNRTPCSPLKVNRRFGGKYRLHFKAEVSDFHQFSRWFLSRLILRHWWWRRYFPPKRRVTLSGPHIIISQKIVSLKDSCFIWFLTFWTLKYFAVFHSVFNSVRNFGAEEERLTRFTPNAKADFRLLSPPLPPVASYNKQILCEPAGSERWRCAQLKIHIAKSSFKSCESLSLSEKFPPLYGARRFSIF
jgi:hypothetical protein